MLHVRQYKTGDPVVVPLRKDARHILIDKYQMRLPRISMVNIDEPVKISHKKGNMARRSFCTNENLAGTPSD